MLVVVRADTGVCPYGWVWAFVSISQRTRLYVVVKNREKRVTGGGGRVIDVRQLEGGGGRVIDVRQLEGGGGREIDVRQLEGDRRQGDRCEATGA